MSDTLNEVRDELKADEIKINNPFDDSNWTEAPTEPQSEPINTTATTTESTDEIVDANEYLKRELGFETWESAKSEFEELKKLKETKGKDFEFANEGSQKFFDYLKEGKEDDVFNFLTEKKRLEKLTSAEINESTAVDIIKLSMQQKYKDLTSDEIDYKFNKMFASPKEPVQTISEDDDEFEVRKGEWQAQVNELKKELIIEAKLSKPELEKLKNELVLPDIKRGNNTTETALTQEELDKGTALRTSYLASLDKAQNSFNGFEARYKNADVEIPISFIATDEEKKALKSELENFAVEDFILNRWFDKDGSPNATQLMEDIYLLRNKEKVFQKLTNESGVKVLDNYIQRSKNINVRGNSGQSFQPNADKTDQQKMAEFFFAQ